MISRTLRDAAGESTLRYASSGVLLDGSGRAITAEIPLPGGATIERSLTSPASSTWAYDDLSANRLWSATTAGALVGPLRVYDPFGTPLTAAAPASAGTRDLAWQGAFGHETQPLRTPFLIMGERVYVPALGRFTQLDPRIGGSSNGYDFVAQDPINLFDPSGRSLGDWIAMFVVAVASVVAAPFTGGGSVLAGIAIGAAIGAVGYLIEFGVKTAIDGSTEFSVAQLCISAGLGAVFGAFGAGAFGKRAAETVETNVTSTASRATSAQTSAAIAETKSTTFTVTHLSDESSMLWKRELTIARAEVDDAAAGVRAATKDKYFEEAMAKNGFRVASERYERIATANPDMYWAIRESLIYP